MIRMFVIVMAFALGSCAHSQPPACPDVPSIENQETLKDYTLHVINMYKECQNAKGAT